MHSHLWCTWTLFTSFGRTDDINRINNAIRQREMMGNIIERGSITRLYSATVPKNSFMEKICEVNRPVRLHILSVTSFTSGMWIWYFFRAIYVQQCKRYSLLFSGPKDNNDFSHCSFILFFSEETSPRSPCKVNVFTKRYTVFVKQWENIHDALLFTPLKKLSHNWPTSYHFALKSPWRFFYILIRCQELALLCLISFVFRSLLVN